MAGRYLGPVQWRPIGENRELCAQLQPAARNGLEWLFQQIGQGAGIRQGMWVVDMGPGIRGAYRALAIQDPNGFRRGFVDLEVQRATASEESTQETTRLLILEHGLLVLDLSDLIPFPETTGALIYPGSTLVSYYGGAGTAIPDADPPRSGHLIGKLVNDPALTPTTNWPDPIPILTDGYHPSVHGVGAATLDYLVTSRQGGGYDQAVKPSAFTGLARAWVQAMTGAAKHPADSLPDGWRTTPGAFGMLQAPDGAYWIAEIGLDIGLRVKPMASGTTTAELAGWLHDGTLTGDAAKLARAYVLADLVPSGDTLTLLTAAEIALAYSGHGTDVAEANSILMDDAFPSGVTATAPYGSSYAWATSPTPYLGTVCLQVSTGYDPAATWFEGSATLATVPPMGALYAWVYLPSTTTWRELLIQVYTGSRRICAYWGTDDLNQYTHSMLANRVRIGDLPGTRNAWVKLEIPAGALGLENEPVKGLAFWAFSWDSSYTVYWDKAAVYAPPESWAEGDATPLQRGWVWDSTGTAAAIVTHRTYRPGLVSQAGESALSTVAITWADGVPSATISIGDWARSRPYWTSHKFWYGEPDDLALLRHGQIWPGNTDCAASAPIVCWYEGDTLKVVRYYKVSITSTADRLEGTTNVNLLTCGDYAYSRTGTSGAFTMVHGGYGLSQPPPMAFGSGGWTEKTLTRSAGAWNDGWRYQGTYDSDRAQQWDSLVGMQNSAAGVCACGQCYPYPDEGIDWQNPTKAAKWFLQSAAGRLVVDSASITNATGGHIYVYLSDSPDALWGVSGQRYGRKQGGGKMTWEKEIRYAARMDLVDYYTDATIQSAFVESKTVMFGCYYGDTPHCVGEGGHTQDPSYDRTNVFEGSAIARIGGTEYEAGTWEDWDHLDANGLEPPYQIGVGAIISADGEAIYITHQGADRQSTAGIPDVALDDSDGHARVRAWAGSI